MIIRIFRKAVKTGFKVKKGLSTKTPSIMDMCMKSHCRKRNGRFKLRGKGTTTGLRTPSILRLSQWVVFGSKKAAKPLLTQGRLRKTLQRDVHGSKPVSSSLFGSDREPGVYALGTLAYNILTVRDRQRSAGKR